MKIIKKKILGIRLKIINIGVRAFYDDLKRQNIDVVHVDWQPPASGESELVKLLKKMT